MVDLLIAMYTDLNGMPDVKEFMYLRAEALSSQEAADIEMTER